MELVAHLSLGSNLGDRVANIHAAIESIDRHMGKVIAQSKLYITPPVGFEAELDFINVCITIRTSHSPESLLSISQEIEVDLGRKAKSKKEGYSSRLIDIDIILLEDRILQSKELSIPHLNFRERRFVLEPLREIAPKHLDPVSGKSVEELCKLCTDESSITIYEG